MEKLDPNRPVLHEREIGLHILVSDGPFLSSVARVVSYIPHNMPLSLDRSPKP
jgi:hypothetical protein